MIVSTCHRIRWFASCGTLLCFHCETVVGVAGAYFLAADVPDKENVTERSTFTKEVAASMNRDCNFFFVTIIRAAQTPCILREEKQQIQARM